MSENINTSDASSVSLKRMDVIEQISENGAFKIDGIELKNFNLDENNEKKSVEEELFIGKIEKENTYTIGVFNWKFQREGYCYNQNEFGDKFIGRFRSDKRQGCGIYLWKPKKERRRIKSELYHGYYDNNQKNRFGTFIWMDEPENNNDFDSSNFECYIGSFQMDEATEGAYLVKNEDNYYVYYGEFKNGKKDDDNCYYYSSTDDRMFFGKICEDKFIKGYVCYFNDDGFISDFYFAEFDQNEKIKDLKKENELKDFNESKDKMLLFRNVIMGKDYFGEIYQDYKDCVKLLNSNFHDDYSHFEDHDSFSQLRNVCKQFNNDNIGRDLKEHIE